MKKFITWDGYIYYIAEARGHIANTGFVIWSPNGGDKYNYRYECKAYIGDGRFSPLENQEWYSQKQFEENCFECAHDCCECCPYNRGFLSLLWAVIADNFILPLYDVKPMEALQVILKMTIEEAKTIVLEKWQNCCYRLHRLLTKKRRSQFGNRRESSYTPRTSRKDV